MQQPQIRANWAKFTIHSAKRAPEGLRASLLEAIPQSLRATIREAGPLELLPAGVFMALCEAIRTGCGPERARTFFRHSLRAAIDEPLMRPLANGALFVWGRSPASLIRRMPQAWQLVTRNCGQLRAIESDQKNQVLLRAENLPPVCRAAGLIHAWEGGFMGQLDFLSLEGRVETHAEGFSDRGLVEFTVSWKENG